MSVSISFTGNVVEETTKWIESHLRDQYWFINQYIEDKEYHRARKVKTHVADFWKCYGINRPVTLHPHQKVKNMIRHRMRNKYDTHEAPYPLRDLFDSALDAHLESSAVKEAIKALCDDDWLLDLYDEYGPERLAKVKIPVVRKTKVEAAPSLHPK